MTDTVTTSAEAGSLADLQREGRLLCKVGVAARRGRSGTRDGRSRSRIAARTSASPPPRHGRGRAAHVPLASRTLRSRVGLHARPLGRRRAGLRRRDRGRRRDRPRPRRGRSRRAAPAAPSRRPRAGLTLVIAKAVHGLLEASVPSRRDRAHRHRVRLHLPRRRMGRRAHDARRDGQRARPARPRRPDARRSSTRSRSSAGTPVVARPLRDRAAAHRRRSMSTGCPTGTGASSRPASEDASERVLATAIHAGASLTDVEAIHGGRGHRPRLHRRGPHARLHEQGVRGARPRRRRRGVDRAARPSCARPRGAQRSEEFSEWRHPHDLAALARARRGRAAGRRWPRAVAHRRVTTTSPASRGGSSTTIPSGRRRARSTPCAPGRRPSSSVARSPTRPSLRIVRFHVQNDFGDWNTVHHAFTAANALHQALVRAPTPELMRGLVHGALRVYLDRFLNVPAARLPTSDTGDLAELAECWEVQGASTTPGRIAFGFLRGGGSAGRAGRGARARPARRGHRVPLVPGLRGVDASGRRVARGLRRGRARSSPASPASSPPTRRPGASCRPSSASPNASAAAKPSTKRPDWFSWRVVVSRTSFRQETSGG